MNKSQERYIERVTDPIDRATSKLCELRSEMDRLHPLSEHDVEACIVDLANATELLRKLYNECIMGDASIQTLVSVRFFLQKVRAFPSTCVEPAQVPEK